MNKRELKEGVHLSTKIPPLLHALELNETNFEASRKINAEMNGIK